MIKMRNLKKVTAVALAASMVLGSAMNVMAVSGDPVESDGSYEGGGMKYPRLKVTLPTVAKADYDYIADPNDLIADTVTESGDAARYADSKFTGTTGIFFLTTPKDKDDADSKNIYTEKSAAKKVTNNNAQDINVTVKLEQGSKAGDADVTYASSSSFSGTDKELYLAVTDDTTTTPLSASAAAVVTATVNGTRANYGKAYDAATDSYGYKLKDEADLVPWSNCSFYLTGALNKNAEWGDNVKFPSIKVTWAYAPVDPDVEIDEGSETPSITDGTISYDATAGKDLKIAHGKTAANITDAIFDWGGGVFTSAKGTWGDTPNPAAVSIGEDFITIAYTGMLEYCTSGEFNLYVVIDGDHNNYMTLTIDCN